LVEAAFTAIRDAFGLEWTIETQGINVADRPSGAGGDITVRSRGSILLAVEVTERPVDRDRVVATFHSKIAPQGIGDYLFLIREGISDEVARQTRQYFAQGNEINFLEMRVWLRSVLATTGKHGRDIFNNLLVQKLQAAEMPAALKVAWNEQIARITST